MTKHWTNEETKDFVFAVAMDFLSELEMVMDSKGISRKELAARIGVSEGRVSQVFNNPGNLTLELVVKWARALKLKATLLAYEDGDPENKNGPVYSGVFRSCWENVGKPVDGWQLEEIFSGVSPIQSEWHSYSLNNSPVNDEESPKKSWTQPDPNELCPNLSSAA